MLDITRIKEIREDKDINQEKMAEILNVKRSTYSLWELGINIIPLNHLSDFADFFRLSIDYIVGLSNNRKVKNLIKGFNLKTLGKNIKTIRLENNLTQKELADILNVTQVCIAKYERGDICISTSNLYKFCQKFKVSLNEVCGKGKIN